MIHSVLRNRKDKKIVIIYHSFGTALVSALFRFYAAEYKERVIGIIGIGSYPIRSSPSIKKMVQSGENSSKEFLMENADQLY